MKHRKCDSEKYRKSQKRIHAHHLVKVAIRKEEQRKDNELYWKWRKEQERIAEEKHRLDQRLLNLLSFRLWQRDSVYYDRWSKTKQLCQIITVFDDHIGLTEILNRLRR